MFSSTKAGILFVVHSAWDIDAQYTFHLILGTLESFIHVRSRVLTTTHFADEETEAERSLREVTQGQNLPLGVAKLRKGQFKTRSPMFRATLQTSPAKA